MEKVLTTTQYLIFVNLTSFLAILGGIALWLGFVVMGLISRRFEQVFDKITYWQSQMIAPAGLFIYLVMQAIASNQHRNMGVVELWTGYSFLAWSSGWCLFSCYRFYRMLMQLEKGSA